MTRLRALVALSSLILLAAGCSGDPGPPAAAVAGSIPWRSGESQRYVLKNNKGEAVGRGTLSVAMEASTATLASVFTSESSGGRTIDEATVTVEVPSLKPREALRHVRTPRDEETVETTYTEQGALIKQGERQSGLSVPEHSYDNDTSLFLWRTLPFSTGYRASYTTIVTNRRSRHKVTLTVMGRESVRVPAGEFTAWRLEIRTSNARQVAWIADTPERWLVRYDNDRGLFFELESTS